MERIYKVKAGDTLSQIALKFGLGPDGHTQIAGHPENQSLFSDQLRNEFRINPGDKLVIPEVVASQHAVQTNQKVSFKTQSRKGFLSLKPQDANGVALSQFKYEIILGDVEEQGDETTNAGLIQVHLPSRFAKTKEEGRVVCYWPNNLTEEERDSKSVEEIKQHQKGIVKLYANPNDSEEHHILNINLELESKGDVIGIKQCLANELKFGGPIKQKIVGQNLEVEDEIVHQMVSDEVNNVASLPAMTSIVNLRPDYYPLVWEFLRYGRILEIAKNKHERLDEELTEAKESNDSFSIIEFITGDEENKAYDALAIRTEKARMDVAYYQYCFIRWSKEFELVWNAHQPNSNPVDVVLQKRQHGVMEESLKQLVQDWNGDFASKDSIQELLALKFEPVPYPPQEYDVYSPIYNTKNITDQLSTHIVSVPMTSRVRFSYKDDPEQFIANSYVIYWRYDKAGKDIEKGRETYYQKSSIMMPIGIGKTDSEGYLVQSIPFSNLYHNGFMHVEDNKFAMQSGWGFKDGKIDDSFVPSHDNYADLVDLKDEVKSLNIPEGPWDDIVARVNKDFPEYSEGGDFDWRTISIASTMHVNAVENSESYAELNENLIELRKAFPNHYRELRTTSSNHLFNHYSSGQQDTYGFMVYPPDGGLFQTEDLAKLGNDGEFAYKGPVKAPNEQHEPIALHCTLQEWERRLRVLNVGIKKDIDDYYSGTSSHRENMVNITRMEELLDIHNRYPYEKVSPELLGKKKELAAALEKLSSGVKDRMINPDSSSDEDAYNALESMREYKNKLVKILLNEEFKKEYLLHRDAEINEYSTTSPYMQVNETWKSIYDTISDSLALLGSTPWASEVYNELLDHPLNALASAQVVTDVLERNQNGIFSKAETHDVIKIDKSDNSFNETKEFFNDRYNDYLGARPVKPVTIIAEIIANEDYQTADFVKDKLDSFVNNNPGPSSVLMVILDTYGSFLHKEMIAGNQIAGFHIRILVATHNSFKMFTGRNKKTEVNLLKILRTNKTLRKRAKIANQSEYITTLKEAMKKEKHSKRLKTRERIKFLERKLKATRSGNKKVLSRLKRQESNLSEEVYSEARGNVANLYKTTLHLMNIVQLAEDIQKASKISQQQHVDPDIVVMTWLKTSTDSAVVTANSILLANRWVDGVIKNGGFLDEAGKFSLKAVRGLANGFAIAGGIISLYISTREAVSLWGHKDEIERADACIEILSNSLLIVGTVATTELGAAILSRFTLLALIPGIAPFLMIAGTVLFLIHIGIGIYQYYESKNYLDTHPVGYYFWQEFKELQDSGQAYYDEDYTRPGNQKEEEGYKELLKFQMNEYEFLGEDQDGWGHLSWRAAVPLYNMWRKRDANDKKLAESIGQMIKTPHQHVEVEQTARNVLVSFEDITHLLSGESYIRFYTYIEAIIISEPNKIHVFKCSNKSYHTIMSELESGEYIPQGETDEIVEIFEQLEIRGCAEFDKDDWLSFLPKFNESRSKYTHWDHPHFRLPASEYGLVPI